MRSSSVFEKLQRRGLFVFSDPAGAKAVLALAKQKEPFLDDYKLISDREYMFVKEFKLRVPVTKERAEELIHSFKPSFVFTSTSYTSKLELNYLRAAKQAGVMRYSFV